MRNGLKVIPHFFIPLEILKQFALVMSSNSIKGAMYYEKQTDIHRILSFTLEAYFKPPTIEFNSWGFPYFWSMSYVVIKK